MKATTFVNLQEAAMRSEQLGTSFERVVLGEILKFTKGVNKVIPAGSSTPENTPTNKLANIVKPNMKNLESIGKNGIYDLNLQEKLESTHPDFILDVLPGKHLFGYDDQWKIHIEAKSTTTGRFKFGQNKVDNIFIDEDSQSMKYLMWFAYRKPEYIFNREAALSEFNSMKRKFLDIFKILSGHDYRLIHAVPGSPVEWLILDDTVEFLRGHFEISPRGVLRYVLGNVDYFILEKVTSSGGEIRMYSKEKVMREKGAKLTPFKKVEEATELPENLQLIFKATREISSAIGTELKPDKDVHVLVKAGERKIVSVAVKHSGAQAKAMPKELIAAGTNFDKKMDLVAEELRVSFKS
jgi:hypothetical protein